MAAGWDKRTTYQSLITAKEVYIHMFCSKGLEPRSISQRAVLGQKKQSSTLPGRYASKLGSLQPAPSWPTLLMLQAALQKGNVSVPHDTMVQTGADHEVLVLVGLPGQSCSYWWLTLCNVGICQTAPVHCRQWQKHVGNQICCKSSREALRCAEC